VSSLFSPASTPTCRSAQPPEQNSLSPVGAARTRTGTRDVTFCDGNGDRLFRYHITGRMLCLNIPASECSTRTINSESD
jgi:hypothetical protein